MRAIGIYLYGMSFTVGHVLSFFGSDLIYWINYNVIHSYNGPFVFLPAIAIHLWLPLFALAIIIVRLLTYFGMAVQWMQRFIKQGRIHPLDAAGYVAAAIVFIAACIFRLVLV
jgi:hypothetical protein